MGVATRPHTSAAAATAGLSACRKRFIGPPSMGKPAPRCAARVFGGRILRWGSACRWVHCSARRLKPAAAGHVAALFLLPAFGRPVLVRVLDTIGGYDQTACAPSVRTGRQGERIRMAYDKKTWRCGKFNLTFDRPRIMGVLNVTPDSFSDGGENFDHDVAIKRAWRCSTPAPTSLTWAGSPRARALPR